MKRSISVYGKYFIEFYRGLNSKVQDKVDWVFELIKTVDFIPKKFFEHIENTEGIYEIRIAYESNIYRIFCFFDEGNLIILINAFQKKSQKTPKKEIEMAKNLMKQYFTDKNNENEIGKKSKK